jgi:hypothetical protein
MEMYYHLENMPFSICGHHLEVGLLIGKGLSSLDLKQ